VGKGPLQALDGDVREAQVDGPLDVQQVVLLLAAGVEDDGAGLAAHLEEVLLGEPPRLAVLRRLAGDAEIPLHVDGGVRDGRFRFRVRGDHGGQEQERETEGRHEIFHDWTPFQKKGVVRPWLPSRNTHGNRWTELVRYCTFLPRREA